jgi:hypothetical protein
MSFLSWKLALVFRVVFGVLALNLMLAFQFLSALRVLVMAAVLAI